MSEIEEMTKEILVDDVYGLSAIPVDAVSTVYDFGANIGVFAECAAERFKCPVFAFEPFYPQFIELKQRSYRVTNICPVSRAVTSDGREVHKEEWAMTMQDRITDDTTGLCRYVSTALSNFTKVKGALFKIDIEGTEMEMMDDILKLTKHNYVSIELHHQGREVDQFLKLTKNTVVQNGDGIVVARCRPSVV